MERGLRTLLGAAALAAMSIAGGGAAEAQSGGSRDTSLLGGGPAKLSCREPGRTVESFGVAGGKDADVSKFPFIVQVRVGLAKCGGALIAPGFALTAAHCVMPEPAQCASPAGGDAAGRCDLVDPRRVRVIRPSPSGLADGDFRGVKAMFVHPNFRYPKGDPEGALDADIAILVLDQEFRIGLDKVVTVADPLLDQSFASGGECARVAGWGRTDVIGGDGRVLSSGVETQTLQSLNLRLVEQERCRSRYGGLITGNMMCAGDGVEGFNTCKGDSGGPLVVDVGQPILVGLVSWAFGCAQAEHYTVFTRVGAPEVRQWINDTIKGPAPE